MSTSSGWTPTRAGRCWPSVRGHRLLIYLLLLILLLPLILLLILLLLILLLILPLLPLLLLLLLVLLVLLLLFLLLLLLLMLLTRLHCRRPGAAQNNTGLTVADMTAGMLSGTVQLYSHELGEEAAAAATAVGVSAAVGEYTNHVETCRALSFTHDGRHLLTVSKDMVRPLCPRGSHFLSLCDCVCDCVCDCDCV